MGDPIQTIHNVPPIFHTVYIIDDRLFLEIAIPLLSCSFHPFFFEIISSNQRREEGKKTKKEKNDTIMGGEGGAGD